MEVFIDLQVGMMREAVPRSGTASLTMEILFVNFMGFEAYCLIEDAFCFFFTFCCCGVVFIVFLNSCG